ncbi:dual specificity protein phosphatase CDC14C-like isoform X1 [Diabrotica virgifera virgifera]|uniref:protein-tyrosine-phosphatase n=1 Tax=Diabrotica virgifera virgifera TaxID=50390 RepID=A0ABM5JHY1_DIAVI|nr:dual specificity protein phosphatase CDC14C-like isoform X1 [Diabrotica virgifera virgifera]
MLKNTVFSMKNSPITRSRKIASKRMENTDNVLLKASEFIKGRLYFVSVNCTVDLTSTKTVHYFTINKDIKYDSFHRDFGPFNLAMIYHYCMKLKRKLSNPSLQDKKIVHYVKDCTELDGQKRVNSAFLVGAYSIIYLGYSPERAYEILTEKSTKEYLKFRDASIGEPYTLSLFDCLKGIKKALDHGFFNLSDFDYMKYEHYEKVENGDLNWIVPDKFIAFCGPQGITYSLGDHKPETYFPYFRNHNVSTVVRLNKKAYDSNAFIEAGFDHKDLYFVDGGTPSERILQQFITVSENAKGVIAVHCKAGLGRTGSLIGCYIMKHYKFTAEEAIAWIRICRPGSIIGHQQSWLQEKQKQMWETGDTHRKKHGITAPIKHKTGIYSLSVENKDENSNPDTVRKIAEEVDHMDLRDSDEECDEESQGNQLNRIKLQRGKIANINSCNHKQSERIRKVSVNMTSNIIRTPGKVTTTTKTFGCTESSRVVTKRIDGQSLRRATKKKITSSMVTVTTAKTPVVEKRQVMKKKDLFQNVVNKAVKKEEINNGEVASNQNKAKKRVLAREREMARRAKMLRRTHPIALTYNKIDKTETVQTSTVKVNETL